MCTKQHARYATDLGQAFHILANLLLWRCLLPMKRYMDFFDGPLNRTLPVRPSPPHRAHAEECWKHPTAIRTASRLPGQAAALCCTDARSPTSGAYCGCKAPLARARLQTGHIHRGCCSHRWVHNKNGLPYAKSVGFLTGLITNTNAHPHHHTAMAAGCLPHWLNLP